MSDLSHKDLWEHIELWGWHIASVLLIFIVFPIARWIGNNTLLRVKKIEEEIPKLATREELRDLNITNREEHMTIGKKLDEIMNHLLHRNGA